MNRSKTILSDKEFIQRLKQAHQIQKDIAHHFCKLGFDAWVPDLEIRENFADRRNFQDGADIFINLPNQQLKIEVKAYGYKFRDHFEWPGRDVHFEAKGALERKLRKNPDIHAQIMVSRPTNRMFVIPFADKSLFYLVQAKHFVKNRSVDSQFYAISKYNCISFYDYVQGLKQYL